MGNEPKKQGESDAQEQTGDDGKVKRGVFAAMNDVAGQSSQTERKFAAEIEESTDENQEAAEKEKRAAEFAKRVHEVILPEAAKPAGTMHRLLLLEI